MKHTLVTALILAIGLAGPAWSQQVANADPKEPRSVEAAPQTAPPLKIRVEDPAELFRQFQQIHLLQKGAAAAGTKTLEKNTEADDGTDVRRIIEIDPQQVVNFFPSFLFGDVTPRDGGSERLPRLTMQQRRAAVEEYRRALAKKNGN